MRSTTRFGAVLAMILCAAAMILPSQASAAEEKLFVNLTSDEMNRAAMAILFSTKVRSEKKIPVTIFLNVDGARIADTNIPQHQHLSGMTLQQMLQAFMQQGGRVILCPMCMKIVGGMSKDDVLEGVEIGGPDVTWPALFAEDVTVLSY